MRRSLWLLVLVLMTGFSAAAARPAAACSCAGFPSPCQAFAASPVVFVGDVLSAERTGNAFRMRVRVVRALKGISEATADVWSDARTSCGVLLTKGRRYVIYTSKAGGRMALHACGYGRQLAPGEPIPELPPVAGRIYGRVSMYDIDRVRSFEQLEAVPSIRIGIALPTGPVTAASDRWGRFQFDDVPPGEYPLSVDAGKGLSPWGARPVVMPDGRACVDSTVVLKPSGKLSGRVLTAGGQPAAGIYVRLLPDGPAGSRLSQLVERGRSTGPDGRFAFDGLRPDRYVVAVNPDAGDATGRQPYAAAWFGGADRATATRIPLAEGAAIELDRPFVLPPPLPTRTFTVAVACQDGSVPPGLMVRAMAANGARSAEFDTTGQGALRTLTLVRDQAYTLHVSIFVPDGPARQGSGPRREEKLAPVDLPAGAPGRHLALAAPFTNCAETAR